MTDNITLPRSVAFEMLEALTCGSSIRHKCQHCGQHIGNFYAALYAALAEPEPTVKDSLTVDHIRSIWRDSWKACPNDPTPVLAEHFARQIERAHGIGLAKPTGKDSLQVASENKVEAMMSRPAPSLAFLDGFRDGFRAAERFHGIKKEDGK
jgi:hypothetical protein